MYWLMGCGGTRSGDEGIVWCPFARFASALADAACAPGKDDAQASWICEGSYLFAWRKRACGACRGTSLEIVRFGKA